MPQILIVEDSESDVFLIREALAFAEVSAELQVLRDGSDAIQFIAAIEADRSAPCPDLMLLDLNLPRKAGDEVLRCVRDSSKCRWMRILIVTSSSAIRDRERMLALKADGYFHKPSDYAEFLKLGEIVKGLLSTGE